MTEFCIIIYDQNDFSTTKGLEDVSHYPQLLTSLMSNHSWTEDQIKKLAGNNLLRVFSKVEKVKIIKLKY